MQILSGSSNQPLAQKIASQFKKKLIGIEIDKFPNGEWKICIKADLEGETCIVVQSFSKPVNDHIIEFLLITDALYRMGASKVMAIIPWIGYSPQDKVFRKGEPLSAKVIASITSKAEVDRIFAFDIHNDSIAGFFSKPLEQLSGDMLFVDHIKKNYDLKKSVIVSPDFGAIKRSRIFANIMDLDHLIIDKQRDRKTGTVTICGISGSVKNKDCFIFDDFISTGQTAILTAKMLKKWGADKVIFSATHHFDVDGVSAKLQASDIDQILIADTINLPEFNKFPKIKVLSTAPIIANNIKKWI